MAFKRYDLFVSYTHSQRDLVTRLASQLRKSEIKVWFDRWEMQPGDFLRDRISSGIEQSRSLLIVVSRDALSSNWVKYELNCGVTAEIERAGVTVIPGIAPGMEYDLLPIDLRAKYCLDFRTPEAIKGSIVHLARFLDPYKYHLLERRAQIRKMIREDSQTSSTLREYLFGKRSYELDASVEIAAISRLEKMDDAAAVLVLAERALSVMHIRVIERTLNALGRCINSGGTLVLASTFTFDSRMLPLKLRLIGKALKRAGVVENLDPYEYKYADDRRSMDEMLALLQSSGSPDVVHGAVLCRAFDRSRDQRGDSLPAPRSTELSAAEQYAQQKLPGFLELLNTANFGHF
jgi:hypothetical protein